MEREILFRGKRVDNGEWVEGHYVQREPLPKPLIVTQTLGVIKNKEGNNMRATAFEVAPETLGQFTGLFDKNGRKIFEGDIVHAVYQTDYVGCKNIDFGIGVVKYRDSYYGGASYQMDIIGEIGSRVFTASLEKGVKVIGNVYDNPELLKGEQLCFF